MRIIQDQLLELGVHLESHKIVSLFVLGDTWFQALQLLRNELGEAVVGHTLLETGLQFPVAGVHKREFYLGYVHVGVHSALMPRINIMQHKFNIAAFTAKKRSATSKIDIMALPSPKEDPEVTPEDLVLEGLTSRQFRLYEKIFADSQKAYRSKSESKHCPMAQSSQIDQMIGRHLKQKQDLDRFKQVHSVSVTEQPTYRKHPVIMETAVERDRTLLKKLSIDPEQSSTICENSILQFYYYRDTILEIREKERKQRQRRNSSGTRWANKRESTVQRQKRELKELIETQEVPDIRYLRNDYNTEKHRKLTDSSKKTELLYASHNESTVCRAKVISFMKNEKQVQAAVKLARRNVYYKRSLNQDRVKYLISSMNLSKSQSQPQSESKSILKKLFFKFSNKEGSEKSRYKEVTIERYVDLIRKLRLGDSFEEQASQMFYEIVSYKQQKILCLQDFIAAIHKVAEKIYGQKGSNVLETFVDNYIRPNKELYQEETYQLLNVYRDQIHRFIKRNKLLFCLESLFKWKDDETTANKDFYSILSMFTVCSLIPPLQSNKIHYFYSYLSNDYGVNIKEFVDMVLLVGLNEEIGLRSSADREKFKVLLEGNDKWTITKALDKFFNKLSIYDRILNGIVLPKQEYC